MGLKFKIYNTLASKMSSNKRSSYVLGPLAPNTKKPAAAPVAASAAAKAASAAAKAASAAAPVAASAAKAASAAAPVAAPGGVKPVRGTRGGGGAKSKGSVANLAEVVANLADDFAEMKKKLQTQSDRIGVVETTCNETKATGNETNLLLKQILAQIAGGGAPQKALPPSPNQLQITNGEPSPSSSAPSKSKSKPLPTFPKNVGGGGKDNETEPPKSTDKWVTFMKGIEKTALHEYLSRLPTSPHLQKAAESAMECSGRNTHIAYALMRADHGSSKSKIPGFAKDRDVIIAGFDESNIKIFQDFFAAMAAFYSKSAAERGVRLRHADGTSVIYEYDPLATNSKFLGDYLKYLREEK